MPSHGDEFPSFSPSIIPNSTTQDLPKAPADLVAEIPPNTALETLGHDMSPVGDFGLIWQPTPGSPRFSGSSARAPGDLLPCVTDADMLWVNADATLQPEPGCCSAVELVEEDAAQQSNWRSDDVELQRLLEEVGPVTATDEKLVEAPAPAPAPQVGSPYRADADMAEVNAAGPFACASSQHVEEEAERRFGAFESAVRREVESSLLPPGFRFHPTDEGLILHYLNRLRGNGMEEAEGSDISTDKPLSIVGFTGPDSKGKKPHQARWKEQSMKGMCAVADPWLQPGPPYYIGLKKTLELDDDGSGNKWRADEYTPLLPAHDDPTKLVAAENSLRVVYKVDQPPSSKSKRPRPDNDGSSNGAKKVSDAWEHMTTVYAKAPTDNADGSSKRKKDPYRRMFAICNHCHKVFNASDSGRGNLLRHLDKCECDCPKSH